MKLPTKKKILRIRQTIYEDPGNPFADELENEEVAPDSVVSDDKSLPQAPKGLEESFARLSADSQNPYSLGELSTEPLKVPADSGAVLDAIHAPMSRHQSTPSRASAIRAHRRSKSVAVPLSSPTDEYVAPRRFWRPGSLSTKPMSEHGEAAKDGNIRDTTFYGFYEDIMRDYRGRDSRL